MIVGGGNVGMTLATALEKSYQVKLIDNNRQRCENLAEVLNHTTVLLGNGTDRTLLINENIGNMDVFCATTDDDEVNILSSIQAKKLGASVALPLIKRTAYVDLIEGNDIHLAISPQLATASAILTHIRKGDVEQVYSLRHGAAEAIEAVAHGDEKTSKVVGRTLTEIKLPQSITIGALSRGEEVIIPDENTRVQANDHIILFVADTMQIPKVEALFEVSASFF
jgi:trk system potassium uptake protein TrkA